MAIAFVFLPLALIAVFTHHVLHQPGVTARIGSHHRAGGFGLRTPEVIALRPGGFAEWMRRRGRLGSQNKVPRVIADPPLFADLRAFTEANRQSD